MTDAALAAAAAHLTERFGMTSGGPSVDPAAGPVAGARALSGSVFPLALFREWLARTPEAAALLAAPPAPEPVRVSVSCGDGDPGIDLSEVRGLTVRGPAPMYHMGPGDLIRVHIDGVYKPSHLCGVTAGMYRFQAAGEASFVFRLCHENQIHPDDAPKFRSVLERFQRAASAGGAGAEPPGFDLSDRRPDPPAGPKKGKRRRT